VIDTNPWYDVVRDYKPFREARGDPRSVEEQKKEYDASKKEYDGIKEAFIGCLYNDGYENSLPEPSATLVIMSDDRQLLETKMEELIPGGSIMINGGAWGTNKFCEEVGVDTASPGAAVFLPTPHPYTKMPIVRVHRFGAASPTSSSSTRAAARTRAPL
jgi:hypothetical protein